MTALFFLLFGCDLGRSDVGGWEEKIGGGGGCLNIKLFISWGKLVFLFCIIYGFIMWFCCVLVGIWWEEFVGILFCFGICFWGKGCCCCCLVMSWVVSVCCLLIFSGVSLESFEIFEKGGCKFGGCCIILIFFEIWWWRVEGIGCLFGCGDWGIYCFWDWVVCLLIDIDLGNFLW